MNYGDFIFDRYDYDAQRATLTLRYRYAKGPSFEEHIHFEGKTRPLEIAHEKVLDRLFRLVFLLSGVSYYKAFIPRTLLCEAFPLDARTAAFVERVYVNGLAEFAFRNGISLRNNVNLRSEPGPEPTGLPIRLPRRTCVPVGGGKDSIVTLECLKTKWRTACPVRIGGCCTYSSDYPDSGSAVRSSPAAIGRAIIRVKRSRGS